jgi:putative transposase
MAGRNITRIDIEQSYYHVYARGVNAQNIFREPADYTYFLYAMRRYLAEKEMLNSAGIPYDKLGHQIEVLCYCLMTNHFHILVYQIEQSGLQRLMRRVMTAYSRYFNAKYERRGPLFESRYRACLIDEESHFEHISRYIHLNPVQWRTYPYSSLGIYLGQQNSDWLKPGRIIEMFDSIEDYRQFVTDYEAAQRELESIKHQLADRDEW